MAENAGAEVSRHDFAVAYDGAARAHNHSIDVEDLSPALMAFGRLIREANAEFNGKQATARVLVVSDFEAKCFHINFQVILSLYQQLKTLLGSDNVTTAKEILEWIGLIDASAMATTGSVLSFLEFLKWKRGRKAEAVTSDRDATGLVEVHIVGDGNTVNVDRRVFNLSVNPRALRATRDALMPVGHDGFDVLKIEKSDGSLGEIDSDEVEQIVASCASGIEESKEIEPGVEITPAWLSVYSPVYDVSAPNWRFRLGTDVIYADISETDIAKEALERGGAMAEDAYQVRLEITTPVDAKGKEKTPTYKILSVTRFVAAPQTHQGSLFDTPKPSTA